MVFTLEIYYVHCSRTLEKKDSNPLNEVRMLYNSIRNNKNKLGQDSTIKYVPSKSVLKYEIGDEIELNENDFINLPKAFFTGIENKFHS